MNKSKHTGTKISEYPSSLSNTTNKKYKLLYDHFLMSYAPVNFGISTINKNYRIPIQALRDDIKYYIGIENAKGDWRNLIKVWSGDWDNEDKTKSYVYEWKSEEQGSNDYIIDKFKSNEDDYDRIFFIKDAPIPLESEQADPAPESNKFVNKKYIDDRFNGIRKVTVDDTTLEIRPYPCVYEYSTMPSSINIVDTLTLEDERTIKACIENNCLIFYIKLPTPESTTLSVKANTVDTKWGFSGELTQLLSTAKKNGDSGLIKCYAEYINGTFTVHCTNGMNLKPGEGGTVTIDTTDTIVDGSDAVPTSNAVYDHVKLHEDKNIHITSIERTSWNNNITNTTNHINNSDIHITDDERTSWNNKIDSITGDDFINCSKNDTNVSLSLNTTDEIIDSSVHVPTSESIYETLVARTPWEKDPIITEIEDITYNSIDDTSTNAGGGAWGGICFIPTENIKITSLTLREIQAIYQNNQSEDVQQTYIKIWSKDEAGNWKLVANNTTKNSTRVTNSTDTTYKYDYTWDVQAIGGGDFIAKAGQEYHVTLNGNYDSESYEIGYKIRFKVYSPNGKDLVLANDKSIPHTDTRYTPNITLSGKKMSIELPSGIEEKMPTEFYGEYLNNHHNISHKFDYNITQKQVKSYQDGTVTFADNTKIQYDIYPATIANYAFRQSSTESLRTLEKFNERIKGHGVPGNNYTSYYYHERDAISPMNNNLYDDDLSENTTPCRHLGNIINGNQMFLRSKLTVFNDNLTSLTSARQMFSSSNLLTEFRSALPSLTYGDKMFNGCALKIFRTKLPRLSHAECMFRTNRSLVYVDTVLPSLTYAQGMFGRCDKLKRIDLSENSGECLYNADDMFAGCSSLTYCKLNLSYLETARNMFGTDSSYGNPKLDIESIKYMCETIKDWKTLNNWMNKEENISVKNEIEIHPHLITFGINQSGDSYRNSNETDENNYKFYIEKARKKGWDVTIYYSGGASEVYSAL